MPLDLGRYGSRDILKLQIYDMAATPIMFFDYANTATYEGASTRVYAWGAGQRRIAWDGEKEYTLTVETQIVSMQHLALLTGESVIKGQKDIFKVEDTVVGAGGVINLSKAPIGGVSGVAVYPFINGVIDNGIVQTVDTVVGNEVTLDAGTTLVAGDEVQVWYQFQAASANTISFTANGFPKYVKLVGDTLWVDEIAKEATKAQIVYYQAKLQPNFSIGMSSQGDPASISLVFDLFPAYVNGIQTIADMTLYED